MGKRTLNTLILSLTTAIAYFQCLNQTLASETPPNTANNDKQLVQNITIESLPSQLSPQNGCRVERASDEWIDGVRARTHTRLCNTASWLDGLFGEDEPFPGSDFRGKVSLGFKHDEIDGIDPRVRVKIKTDLPNISKRFDAFLGRVEEDSYIANTEVQADRLTNVGLRSTNDEQSEWLVGLGYRVPSKDNNGFDLSVGAKLSGGFSPYSRLTHRHLFDLSTTTTLKTTQTAFWRREDGFGISTNAEITKFFGENNIWHTTNSLKFSEESDQIEWISNTAWHHTLSDKRGISSSAYLRGEQDNLVSIPEYGLTFTYIRPVLRDWLFMETGVDFRWERELPGTSYKSAVRVGLQFEMLLGDYYNRHKLRKTSKEVY